MPEWKLKAESNRKKADTKPSASMHDILTYWDREDPVYRSLLVKVIKKTGNKLQFKVCNPNTGTETKRNFSLNLNDYANVMSEMPSTAMLATKAKPYGLLFVAETWVKAKKITPLDDGNGGGGGKFPKTSSL